MVVLTTVVVSGMEVVGSRRSGSGGGEDGQRPGMRVEEERKGRSGRR